MSLSAELLRDLATLSQALDDPDLDLAQIVTGLSVDSLRAVPSYLGLVILIESDGQDISLNAFDDPARSGDARTSMFASFIGRDVENSDSVAISLVLYAETPGAFVDITADLAWLDTAADVMLDQHLPAPDGSAVSDALIDLTTVNQALGVLLARGNTPEQAEIELRLVGDTLHLKRANAAASILAGLADRPRSA